MQTLSEFFRSEFVRNRLVDADHRTIAEYQSSVNRFVQLCGDGPIGKIGLLRNDFVQQLEKQGAAPRTILKHLKQLNVVFGQFPAKYRIRWTLIDVDDKEPRQVSDAEFQALYRAFGSETRWPRHLPEHLRPHFWRSVMCFAAITALRREAILGVEFRDVNWNEQYLCLRREIDKAKQKRYKPLTPQILEMIGKLRRTHTNNESNTSAVWLFFGQFGQFFRCQIFA